MPKIYVLKVETGTGKGGEWKRVDYLTTDRKGDITSKKSSFLTNVDIDIEMPSSDYLEEVFANLPNYDVEYDSSGNILQAS